MMDKPNCSYVKESLFQYVRDCYWNIFRGNTAILSSTCRQLALGIGGVLLINGNIKGICNKFILTLLVLFFIVDAGQYAYQSFSFHKLAKKYDDQIEAGKIIEVSNLIEPPGINTWTN
jgi:hypothetical protein